jgi:hypothetical protein
VETGGEGNGDRGGGVPFALPAGVDIDVGLVKYHRHRLRPSQAEWDDLAVHAGGGLDRKCRGADAADQEPRAPTCHRGAGAVSSVLVDKVRLRPGSATAPTIGRAFNNQGDVYRPVASRWLAELPGTIERVDDPDPST